MYNNLAGTVKVTGDEIIMMKSKYSQKNKNVQIETNVVLIGGGAGGLRTAIELANMNYKVIIIEKRENIEVMRQIDDKMNQISNLPTSFINPGRAGHGFHYKDITTAKMLLEATIGVYQKYPSVLRGKDLPKNHNLNKGRYFIVKNSLTPKKELLTSYDELKKHYKMLISKDPSKKVLGEPEDFYRKLKKEAYKAHVNESEVKVGLETTERLIDPLKLAEILAQEVKKEKNIKLKLETTVTQIRYGTDKVFEVVTQNNEIIKADYVINCAWENLEAIDQTLGLYDPQVKVINRLKALAHIELPTELIDQHSMFFCLGPFAMFSNLGDGTGLITYAPATNVENFYDSKISETGRKFLNGTADEKIVQKKGQEIINGVSFWIPAIAQAKLKAVRFGIVKTYGDVDIYDPNSSFHKRDYFGVSSAQIGFIDNACMKLMNLLINAKLVAELLSKHQQVNSKIDVVSEEIVKNYFSGYSESTMKLFWNRYLKRNFNLNDMPQKKTEYRLKESCLDIDFPKQVTDIIISYLFLTFEKSEKTYINQISLKKNLMSGITNSLKKESKSYPIYLAIRLNLNLPNAIANLISLYCSGHRFEPICSTSLLSSSRLFSESRRESKYEILNNQSADSKNYLNQ